MDRHDRQKLELLFSAWVDGGASDQQEEELARELSEDEEARRYYLDFVAMHVGLHWQGRDNRAISAEDDHLDPAFLGPEAPLSLAKEDSARKRSHVGWSLAVALTLLLALAVWWQFSQERNLAPSANDLRVESATAAKKPTKVARSLAGVVWHAQNAQFAASDRPVNNGDMVHTGKLALKEGAATIALMDGAVLNLLAPCEVNLISQSKVTILRGRVRVDIPTESAHIEVSTPAGQIKHLGTVFAVAVEPSGSTRVSIEEGAVEWSTDLHKSNRSATSTLYQQGDRVNVSVDGRAIEPEDEDYSADDPLLIQFASMATSRIYEPKPLEIAKDGFEIRYVRADRPPPPANLRLPVLIGSLDDAERLLAGQIAAAEDVTSRNVPFINFQDGNTISARTKEPFASVFPNYLPFPGDNSPGDHDDQFVILAKGTLLVRDAWRYTFLVNNDDGARLRIDGKDIFIDDGVHKPMVSFAKTVLEAGEHKLELLYRDERDTSRIELGYAHGWTSQIEDFRLLQVGGTSE